MALFAYGSSPGLPNDDEDDEGAAEDDPLNECGGPMFTKTSLSIIGAVVALPSNDANKRMCCSCVSLDCGAVKCAAIGLRGLTVADVSEIGMTSSHVLMLGTKDGSLTTSGKPAIVNRELSPRVVG